MAKRIKKEDLIKEFKEIYSVMQKYLNESDHNFHKRLHPAYCNNCQLISKVGGDYTILTGRDCGGNHYKTEKSPETCILCHGYNFVKISIEDFSGLIKLFRQKTPEIIIQGIENGLKKMTSPSLYNADLPEIYRRWRRLSKKEMIKQVKTVLLLDEEIFQAKQSVRDLKASLY